MGIQNHDKTLLIVLVKKIWKENFNQFYFFCIPFLDSLSRRYVPKSSFMCICVFFLSVFMWIYVCVRTERNVTFFDSSSPRRCLPVGSFSGTISSGAIFWEAFFVEYWHYRSSWVCKKTLQLVMTKHCSHGKILRLILILSAH